MRHVPIEKTTSPMPRLPVTDVPAREFLSRRVASRSVVSPKNELQCVCRSVSPVQLPPRVLLVSVFASLATVAAKSKVSRLLGRLAGLSMSAGCVPRPIVKRSVVSAFVLRSVVRRPAYQSLSALSSASFSPVVSRRRVN